VTNAGAVSVRVVVEVVVVVVVAEPGVTLVVLDVTVLDVVVLASAPPLGGGVVELTAVDVVVRLAEVVEVVVLALARVWAVCVCVVRVGVVLVTAAFGVVAGLLRVVGDPPPPQPAGTAAARATRISATAVLSRRDGCRSQSRRATDILRDDGSESDGPVEQRRRVGAALRIGDRAGHCRALRRGGGFSSPARNRRWT
jgi:hypothetical protein